MNFKGCQQPNGGMYRLCLHAQSWQKIDSMMHSYLIVHINAQKGHILWCFSTVMLSECKIGSWLFQIKKTFLCHSQWGASMRCIFSLWLYIFLEIIVTRNILPWTALDPKIYVPKDKSLTTKNIFILQNKLYSSI